MLKAVYSVGCVVAAFGVVALFGCTPSVEGKTMPAIEMTIPDDVPGQVAVKDKEGNEVVVNGRELYTLGYNNGWDEYWNRYRSGKIKLDDESISPLVPSTFIYESRGHVDGFWNCRRAILKSG